MKERKIFFPNVIKKIKIGLWPGHQRASKTPPLSHFSRFCDFQLQLNVVVPKRIELQSSSCAQMKDREIHFRKVPKNFKIGLWAGHQRADKNSYYFSL